MSTVFLTKLGRAALGRQSSQDQNSSFVQYSSDKPTWKAINSDYSTSSTTASILSAHPHFDYFNRPSTTFCPNQTSPFLVPLTSMPATMTEDDYTLELGSFVPCGTYSASNAMCKIAQSECTVNSTAGTATLTHVFDNTTSNTNYEIKGFAILSYCLWSSGSPSSFTSSDITSAGSPYIGLLGYITLDTPVIFEMLKYYRVDWTFSNIIFTGTGDETTTA